jgi:2-C-methyl-D-erythritol 4-phosphate cytidylyltransferase
VSPPSIKILLAVTSALALSEFDGASVLVVSAKVVQQFCKAIGQLAPMTVVAPEELASSVTEILTSDLVEHSILVCDPNDPIALAKVLRPCKDEFEIFVIHDSNRPLTPAAQFQLTIDALSPGIDAVRSSTAFTETLKSVSDAGFIGRTIDRNSIRRISTPEVIRVEAIDFTARESNANSGWFLPLKEDTQVAYVASDDASIRINSEEGILLLDSLKPHS